jgi:hypothetical protein
LVQTGPLLDALPLGRVVRLLLQYNRVQRWWTTISDSLFWPIIIFFWRNRFLLQATFEDGGLAPLLAQELLRVDLVTLLHGLIVPILGGDGALQVLELTRDHFSIEE